jgi:hypothetical protein
LNALSSYGSHPEGDPFSRQVFYVPTPGVANSAISGVPQVYINEWMADNKSTLADPADGDFDDWFELYNAGTTRVDLAGYRLNDRLHPTNSVVVPGGTSIEAGAFLFVWADGQSGWIGSDLHVDFQLSAGGEAVALFLPNGTLVDAVTFGAQQEDVGDGRWPDGAAAIYEMPISTPGTTNRLMNISSFGVTAVGTNLQTTVIWATRPGRRYRLEHTDVLGPATIWSPCGDDFTASGTWFSTNILSGTSVSNRFFRIRQL